MTHDRQTLSWQNIEYTDKEHPEAVQITISNCHCNSTVQLYSDEHLSCQLNQQQSTPLRAGGAYKMCDTIKEQLTVLNSLAGRPWTLN